MEQPETRPDWIAPGVDVLVYRHGRNGIILDCQTVIDRVGKRDAILLNGLRFNVSRCHAATEEVTKDAPGTWSLSYHLVPTKGKRGQEVLASHRKSRATEALSSAFNQWDRDRNDVDKLRQLGAAVAKRMEEETAMDR